MKDFNIKISLNEEDIKLIDLINEEHAISVSIHKHVEKWKKESLNKLELLGILISTHIEQDFSYYFSLSGIGRMITKQIDCYE